MASGPQPPQVGHRHFAQAPNSAASAKIRVEPEVDFRREWIGDDETGYSTLVCTRTGEHVPDPDSLVGIVVAF